MAKCAKKIMQRNKLGDKISLIPKRSTEMTVGPGELYWLGLAGEWQSMSDLSDLLCENARQGKDPASCRFVVTL